MQWAFQSKVADSRNEGQDRGCDFVKTLAKSRSVHSPAWSIVGRSSAAVLFPEKGLYFAFFRWLLTHVRRDLGTAEEIVRAADLEWMIARPTRLLSKPLRQQIRAPQW